MSPEDTDSFIDLEQLVAAARRQIRVVALCAAVGLAMGIVYLAFTPKVYTAATDILLDDSLTRFAEEKDTAPAHIQADSMVLSEVEIMKSTRLARAVVIAAKAQRERGVPQSAALAHRLAEGPDTRRHRHLFVGAARARATPSRIPRSSAR